MVPVAKGASNTWGRPRQPFRGEKHRRPSRVNEIHAPAFARQLLWLYTPKSTYGSLNSAERARIAGESGQIDKNLPPNGIRDGNHPAAISGPCGDVHAASGGLALIC